LTRIEAQQRSPRLAAAHIDALPNPFRRLQVAHPTPEGVRYKYRLYLQAAQKYGVDHVVKRLKRYERRTFKDLLASMPPTIPHPSEVFMREYQRVCREQLAPFFVSETGCIRATDSERTEASEGI
jgi:hypothetical protein